jgi:N-acyl-phosphatidylethanolamine-hydrolysing phospholipase D
LTGEDVLEPPKPLAEECKKLEIDDPFTVCEIRETLFF